MASLDLKTVIQALFFCPNNRVLLAKKGNYMINKQVSIANRIEIT